MTKRELLKQARHVLGPDAKVAITRAGRLDWTVSAYAVNFGVSAGGIYRERAVERVNAMLIHLDTSGWRWSAQ